MKLITVSASDWFEPVHWSSMTTTHKQMKRMRNCRVRGHAWRPLAMQSVGCPYNQRLCVRCKRFEPPPKKHRGWQEKLRKADKIDEVIAASRDVMKDAVYCDDRRLWAALNRIADALEALKADGR